MTIPSTYAILYSGKGERDNSIPTLTQRRTPMAYGNFDVITIEADTNVIDHNYCNTLREALAVEKWAHDHLPIGSSVVITPLNPKAAAALSTY